MSNNTKPKSLFSVLGKAYTAIGRAVSLEPLFNTGGSNGGAQRLYSPQNGGPNANIVAGFGRIRSYSRDVTRKIPELDDGYDTRVANIIGKGIRGIPMCKDEKLREQIKDLWNEWILDADYDGFDLDSMDRILVRERDEAGEVFLRVIYRPMSAGLVVPIQFQVIESECLDHSYNESLENSGKIVAGIEFDGKGKITAYHFFKNNPTDATVLNNNLDRIRVPADEVCHYFKRSRAGQVRGSPRAYAGQMQMRDLMIYEENELERKKNSSATYATIQSTDSSVMSELGNDINTFSTESGTTTAPQIMGTDPAVINKGSVVHLYPGEKLEVTKVAESDPNYDAYIAGKNRTAAKAMGLSYETYSGDLRGNSYSGIRVAKNLEEIKFGVDQDEFIKKVKRFVWQKWFDQAVVSGILKIPDYASRKSYYTAINWQAPGWKYINPLQEINAVAAEINAGISTRTIAAAARGRDFAELQAQIAAERAIEKQFGNDVANDA